MPGKAEIPSRADVVVIGAGLGGLIAGLEMQKNGMQVCIAEKRPIAGGYAHRFRRGRFHFDVSLHHIGGLGEDGMTNKVLGPLGILDLLEYERPEKLIFSEFPDAAYTVPNQPAEALNYLAGLFPDERDGLERLFQYSGRLKNHVIGPILHRDFAVPMEEMLSLENVDDSFEQLLKRYIRHSRLRAMLGQLWMYLGLAPSKSAANYSNCVFASGFLEGGYHVRGGSRAIVDAIVRRFEEEGGVLLLRSAVEKIIVRDGKAAGIQLEDGSMIESPFVASNASPLNMFPGLVDEDQVSAIYRHRLEHMEPSCSAFSMYIGLDCPPERLGIPKGNTFVNHGNDFTEAYDDCMAGRLDDTDWCLTNSGDPTLAPNGTGSIAIVEITSSGDWMQLDASVYAARKADAQKRLLEKYDRRFPGLKEHAEVVEFGTPRTMKRYSSNAHGALYGFAQTPLQANNRRLSNRTPVEGLYLCGAWTQAGGGFEGTMMTGMKAAHMILEASGRDWDTGLRHSEGIDEPNLTEETGRTAFSAGTAGTEATLPDFSDPAYRFYRNTYEIYPDDTDFSGRAKDTAFLRFMDRARVRLVDQSDELRRIRDELDSYFVKLYSITAHIHGDAPAGESVDIHTGYKRATSHRAAVDQCITGNDGRVLLTGRAEIMFVTRNEELVELPAVYQDHPIAPFDVPEAKLPPLLFADLSNHRYMSEFLVSYEDTDTQGVVYNVSYVKIAQKMLWDHRERILGTKVDMERIRCEHISIRFMMPARLHETIVVRAGYRPIDSDRFGMDYRMTLKENGTVLTDIHLEYVRF